MIVSNPNLLSTGWLAPPARLAVQRLTSDQSAPWVVVGAGFTGLAAARRLAEHCPNDRILLIDAKEIGKGSSSRSSGFVVSLGHFERGSNSNNAKLHRLGNSGIHWLRKFVQVHQVDCDWNEQGRMVGARSAPGQASLKSIRKVLDNVGSPYDVLDPQAIKSATGMTCYRAAIRQKESVQVNPAALLMGLFNHLPGNVEVFECATVTRLRGLEPIQLECVNASIKAKRVLITANAGGASLGRTKNRVFPMRTFISVADLPIDSKVGNRFGSERWGITSCERIGSSLRRTGNQIMIRNTARYGFNSSNPLAEIGAVKKIHQDALFRRFPDFELSIAQTWGGVIGITANSAQQFGKLSKGVYQSIGYNGHGIAQGTIAGRLLADLAVGADSSLLNDIQTLPKPMWVPQGILLRAGVKAFTSFLNWRFQKEL